MVVHEVMAGDPVLHVVDVFIVVLGYAVNPLSLTEGLCFHQVVEANAAWHKSVCMQQCAASAHVVLLTVMYVGLTSRCSCLS